MTRRAVAVSLALLGAALVVGALAVAPCGVAPLREGAATEGSDQDDRHVETGPASSTAAQFVGAEDRTPGLAARPVADESTDGPCRRSEPASDDHRVILGAVLSDDGSPLAGVALSAWVRVDARTEWREFNARPVEPDTRKPVATAMSGPDGCFRILLPRFAGVWYVVRAERGTEFRPVEEPAFEGATLPLRLSAFTGTCVLVIDAAGEPVPGAKLWCTSLSPTVDYHYAETDVYGRGWLDDVQGTVPRSLWLEAPAHRGDVKDLYRSDWTPRETALTLERGYVVRGRVLDSRGRAVVRARIRYREDRSEEPRLWDGETDAEGRFEIRKRRHGEALTLVAFDRGSTDSAAGSPEVEAVAGGADAVLVLGGGETLEVVIEGDVENIPRVAYAEREASSPADRPQIREVDVVGRLARIQGLTRGARYSIFVRPVGREGPCGWVRGVPAAAGRVSVTLRPAKAIEGRVVVAGLPSRVDVWARAPAISRSAVVAPDGTFRIGGLPPTTYSVWAAAFVRDDETLKLVRTAPIEVEGGSRIEIHVDCDRPGEMRPPERPR